MSSVSFSQVTLDDILYGKYDDLDYKELELVEGNAADGYLDVSVQFDEQHATLVYMSNAAGVSLNEIQRALAYFGINSMRPHEYAEAGWLRMTNAFMQHMWCRAHEDVYNMDAYAGIYHIVTRHRDTKMKCPYHTYSMDELMKSETSTYNPMCFFCLAAILLEQVSNNDMKPPPVSALLTVDFGIFTSTYLVAFINLFTMLCRDVFITCAHAECRIKLAKLNRDDIILGTAMAMGSISTRGAGANEMMHIFDLLKDIDCPLTDSLFTEHITDVSRSSLEHVKAFNFSTATRVISGLLAHILPGVRLCQRTFTPAGSKPRNKLVLRMPTQHIQHGVIRAVTLMHPGVMARVGAAGFQLREFSEDDSNGYGEVVEKSYHFHPLYKHIYSAIDDITILRENRIESRRRDILEIAHQVSINSFPALSMEEGVSQLVHLYEMALGLHFPFTHVRFGMDNDTRTFMSLARVVDVNRIDILRPLFNVMNSGALHSIGESMLYSLYNSAYVHSSLNIEMQFIMRLSCASMGMRTIVLPRLSWEIFNREPIKDTSVVNATHKQIITKFIQSRCDYESWRRLSTKFVVKSENCRLDC